MIGVIRQYDYAVGDQASIRPPADNPPTSMLDIDELSAVLNGAIKLDPQEVEKRRLKRAENAIAQAKREEEWRDAHKLKPMITKIYISDRPDGFKVCRCCKEEKPYVEFNRNANNKDGFDTICRRCKSIQRKRWYLSR